MTWETSSLNSDDALVFGPNVTISMLEEYGWSKISSYKRVLKDKVMIKSSTSDYPIFVRECKGYGDDKDKFFYKIYEPKSESKAFRFFYYPTGGKIANYVNGYHEYVEYHAKQIAAGLDKKELDPVCICCGERDAMNIYSFGYMPIWFNSETQMPNANFMRQLRAKSCAIYLCPDIDETGVRQGKILALQFPYIRTIWLPESLKLNKDWRGNSCKDVTDWAKLGHKQQDFRNLARIACSCEYILSLFNDKGDVTYKLNLTNLLYYLELHNFYTFEFTPKDVVIVHQNGVTLDSVTSNDIRTFLIEQLKKEFAYRDQINLVISSNKLNDNTFLLLQRLNKEMYQPQQDVQYFLFQNCVLKVTADDINVIKYKDYYNLHSSKEIINHDFNLSSKPFDIYRDINGEYHVNVNSAKSKFFQFVISTSRLYWKEEYQNSKLTIEEFYETNTNNITSDRLTMKQNMEQINALINKLFVIGYLCQNYKSPSRPWAVYAMDNLVKGNFDSNGRSGKSLFFRMLSMVSNQVTINGRQKKLTDNMFIYDRVTTDTNHIIVDDINVKTDLGFFYDDIAGDLFVNRKSKQSISIPFALSPKFIFTSNFVPLSLDPSTEGRLLYCTFSDYYHIKTDKNDYPSSYTVYDQFKCNLMTDYDSNDWNADLNFIVACVQFYMSTIKDNVKLNPPMDNVQERRDNILIGEQFEDWADFYFSPDAELGNLVMKQVAFKSYQQYANVPIKMTQFTKSLKLYATKHNLRYNYSDDVEKAQRIIRKDPQTRISMEYVILEKKD